MSSTETKFSFASGSNIKYLESLYQDYKNDTASVDPTWQKFFEGYEFALANPLGGSSEGDASEAKVEAFINAYRRLGHLNAHLNPLDAETMPLRKLKPEDQGLEGIELSRTFNPANLPIETPATLEAIYSLLQETYCGHVGADFRDLNDIDKVVWLQEKMETHRNKPNLDQKAKLRIFDKLVVAEGFEKFLQDRYLGQKRFSIEGLEALIPLLDTLAGEAQDHGVEELCVGMAHRGRLNVLANFLGKPYETMLKEFEGSDTDSYGIDGDVKYHKGFASQVETYDGDKLRVYLNPNPSHLEAVNPVVSGFVKARQQMFAEGQTDTFLPLMIHGDASFIGQGLVAETLNLSELSAYETGGTIHVITNNQVGFTTDPRDARSCHYSSDIAKIVRAPVFHVNADDPEAVVWTAQLALEYRQKFKKDVVIDLIGYRRHGHNETDEPSFTQPQMYKTIKKHKTVLTQYGEVLVAQNVLSQDEVQKRKKDFRAKLQDCLDRVRSGNVDILAPVPSELEISTRHVKADLKDFFKPVETGIDAKNFKEILEQVTSFPSTFKPHPKIKKLFASRQKMVAEDNKIDWGLAEIICYGSLALEGYHVRMSGQDCKRGTFSHRHAVVFDVETGEPLETLNQISSNQGRVDIINSPLSEQGVMGFEFGYSVANPEALVLWEAQFGDFANGAQIIIDQFLVASEAKWKQACNLVLLLPHGHEGMGPEHSSARPERFLQLCGDYNIQVANPTKPAQLFHLLRRQVKREFRKPLIIMTPKSLLRHPECVSKIEDFSSEQSFEEVIDDVRVENKDAVERVVFCTGKIFYELDKAREDMDPDGKIAIVRIEQLYPFPEDKVADVLAKYNKSTEVLWTQEEPSNMGAWTFIRHRIKQLSTRNRKFRYSGRVSAGTTAEGYTKAHEKEQRRIIEDTFTLGKASPKKKQASK